MTASAAVALVTSAAAMLNDPGSALNGNATAAAEVRTMLLSTVSAAASNASTPAALQSAASAVSALVSNPLQVSAAGAATALSVLSSVSAAGSSRGVAVSLEASLAVTAGLSSIASAALSPASTVTPGVLLQVSSIVDALASSQLCAITVPGAPPVEVSSPAIQMRVSLDSAGADSRLFTANITAANSSSNFAPMPAGLFGNGTAAAVRTQFVILAFDPFISTPMNTTGVTRLAFTNPDGSPIPVANATTPISFTLPRVDTGGEDQAVCSFWDPAAGAYATHGCATHARACCTRAVRAC